jgi:hypothetical protein
MKKWFLLLLISVPALGETVPEPLAQELERHRLRGMISPPSHMVCQTMHDRFLVIGEQLGYDRVARSVLASKAIRAMTEVLRKSSSPDFVDINFVAHAAGLPATNEERRYVPVAPLFGEAIGLKQMPLVIFSADDLKYIPFQQMNTDLIIVTDSAKPLTKARAGRVAALAQNLNIRVHTLWTGDSPGGTHLGASQPLAWLAAATGGSFVEFSESGCLNRL